MRARIREYEYNVHGKLSEAGMDIVVEYDNEEDMWGQISAYMAQDSEFQEYANTLSVRDRLSFLWRLFVSDYGRLFLPDQDNTFEYELYEKELIHNLKLQQEFVESVRRSICG